MSLSLSAQGSGNESVTDLSKDNNQTASSAVNLGHFNNTLQDCEKTSLTHCDIFDARVLQDSEMSDESGSVSRARTCNGLSLVSIVILVSVCVSVCGVIISGIAIYLVVAREGNPKIDHPNDTARTDTDADNNKKNDASTSDPVTDSETTVTKTSKT